MRREVVAWWEQAKRDFLSAEHAFNSRDYYVSAFLCHQAVEKGLKAIYLKLNNDVLRIHDLVKLAREVQAPHEIVEQCSHITPVYFEVRYPESEELPAEKINRREAHEIIQLTKAILRWIEKNI
jgi:HEPN domain-containing protein